MEGIDPTMPFALMDTATGDGTRLKIFSGRSGMEMPKDFSGLVRIFIGGSEIIVDTYVTAHGVRKWRPMADTGKRGDPC